MQYDKTRYNTIQYETKQNDSVLTPENKKMIHMYTAMHVQNTQKKHISNVY